MEFLKSGLKTLNAALGPLPLRVLESASTIAFSWYWGNQSWLASHNMTASIIDGTLIFFVVFFGLLMVHLLVYATKLRKLFDPKVVLSLVENASHEIIKEPNADGSGWQEFEGITVKGRVSGVSVKASNCRVYLTEIRILDAATGNWVIEPNLEHIPLRWTQSKEFTALVPNKIEKRFNIVGTRQDNPFLRVAADPINRELYRRLFLDKTKYEIDVLVVADGIDASMTVEIDWRSVDWREITYREVPCRKANI